MTSTERCHNCGSTDIEEDNARGDRVCTNCGSVLDDSLIVSEVQFEEVGSSSVAMGRFVATGTSGAATGYGYGKFHVSSGVESREVTVRKARNDITILCQQLQLTQHFIDTAVNFFRMALMRHLTRGRRSTHVHAACVYMACRLEETAHLLIDISDAQQICSYELGRTYLKLSHALCISVPSSDPCIYILRFVSKLEFGPKTHEVSMTALRIVQRMKKDTMHSGRRPTGLCGAAILIAARMHNYNRSIMNIVNAVKIHECTLRKRMAEFAETPSCALTMEEFMSIDLEAEHDPPAFRAARKKDRERIKKIPSKELTELQHEFDRCLEKVQDRGHKTVMRALRCNGIDCGVSSEDRETAVFIEDSNMVAIEAFMKSEEETDKKIENVIDGVGPNLEAICNPPKVIIEPVTCDGENIPELDIHDINDAEINNVIMSSKEASAKNDRWEFNNASYLKIRREKHERLAKEREDGKPEKKKRRSRKKVIGPSSTAGEAIEKILQEKKISTKINYDILRSLTETETQADIITNDSEDTVKGSISSLRNDDYKLSRITSKSEVTAYGRNKSPSVQRDISKRGQRDDAHLAKRTKLDEPSALGTATATQIAEDDNEEDWNSDSDEETDYNRDSKPIELCSIRDLLCKNLDENDDYGEDYEYY